MTRQIIMKGRKPADEVRALYSQYLDEVIYMPIVDMNDSASVETFTAHNVPSSLLIVPYGKHGWGFSHQFPDRDRIDQAILSFVIGHTK